MAIVGSWQKSVEILSAGVSKENGFIHLAKSLAVPMGETTVFGGNNNDIPMFSVAGVAIAMGNADEETKSFADFVTDTNDNCGIAQVLDSLSFIN